MDKGKAITMEERRRKLCTNSDGFRRRSLWSEVAFEHPATFDTLTMDPRRKEKIIDDLLYFSKSQDYYKKAGKAWKRGIPTFKYPTPLSLSLSLSTHPPPLSRICIPRLHPLHPKAQWAVAAAEASYATAPPRAPSSPRRSTLKSGRPKNSPPSELRPTTPRPFSSIPNLLNPLQWLAKMIVCQNAAIPVGRSAVELTPQSVCNCLMASAAVAVVARLLLRCLDIVVRRRITGEDEALFIYFIFLIYQTF
ncbi:P-loop containing nucleoside triphosphate hydrolases superfamily protein [Perilla frutescens var. hirtella]|nr:P-loop containing nucleoside triphosphate hydrolases superfamily protein [Perilla frutescens var. hirtella]